MVVKVKLKEMRERKGVSQNALARALNMSLANVQKIEYGKAKSMSFELADRLCDVLECEIQELLHREPNQSNNN